MPAKAETGRGDGLVGNQRAGLPEPDAEEQEAEERADEAEWTRPGDGRETRNGQVLAHHLEGEVAAEADAQPGQQRRDAGAEEERQRSRSPGGKRQHGGDQQRAVLRTAERAKFDVDKEREGGEADEEGGHRRGKRCWMARDPGGQASG